MINKKTINFGLLLGGLSVVYFLFTVVIEPGMMAGMGLGLLFLVVNIILLARFIQKERSLNNGVISFKEAFVKGFVAMAIGLAISTFVTLIYINLIDPSYPDRITLQAMEGVAGFMEGNIPDDQMQEALTQVEQDTMERFTLMGQIKGFLIGLIVSAVIALIFAAVLKRKPQPTDEMILDA